MLARLTATALGLGYSPLAPGTFGAAGALLLVYLIHTFLPGLYPSEFGQAIPFAVLIILITLIGVWASREVEKEWEHDDNRIVIDEVAGQLIALIAIPFSFWNIIAGFALFRLFDIYKPLGIRRMERYGNGWGVMLDDVLAGIYANIALQIILKLF